MVLKQFLRVYRLTHYNNTVSRMPPAELTFARKIRSVFDKQLLKKKVENEEKIRYPELLQIRRKKLLSKKWKGKM